MTSHKQRLNYIPWEPTRAAVSRIETTKTNRGIVPEQSISTQLYRYQNNNTNNSKPPTPTPVIGNKPTATVEPFQASINVDEILYGVRYQSPNANNYVIQDLNLSNDQLEFERLQEENASLKQQLEIQTQVNSELKKLLVASVGTDFQYRLERLLR
jgi:hypothetical protein